jgi:hypothetical protein
MTSSSNDLYSTYVLPILEVFASEGLNSALFWRVDGDYAPITFMIDCSDTFWWGAADVETIHPEDLPALRQAFVDVSEIAEGPIWWAELFCARLRGLRPQGSMYEDLSNDMADLFDACGPERMTGVSNPFPQPKRTRTE